MSAYLVLTAAGIGIWWLIAIYNPRKWVRDRPAMTNTNTTWSPWFTCCWDYLAGLNATPCPTHSSDEYPRGLCRSVMGPRRLQTLWPLQENANQQLLDLNIVVFLWFDIQIVFPHMFFGVHSFFVAFQLHLYHLDRCLMNSQLCIFLTYLVIPRVTRTHFP